MRMDNDCGLRSIGLRSCATKRQRISSEANLPPTMINRLGCDLLVEILIRLPNPRFTCRCKLVCKPWSSLISSPQFNSRFVSHHQTMILNHPPMPDDPYELRSIILSFLPPMPSSVRDSFRVWDCNKDMVLCGFWDLDYQNRERSRAFLVCNPFTKQWSALPVAPRKSVGYLSPAARLVCEPRTSIKLDLGGEQAFPYYEYRFRVVCLYQANADLPRQDIKLDVFCSESGKWTKDALVCHDRIRSGRRSVISCNGELFWKYHEFTNPPIDNLVVGFNPFRLDMPPTYVDVSAFHLKPKWYISGSQGKLHVIALENETELVRLSVWRLEQDGKSWTKQREGLVSKVSNYCNYEVGGCYEPFLHPHNPEIVFFSPVTGKYKNALLCCDLGREELVFCAKLERQPDVHHLLVFQPRVSCWTTPIPRYKGLQGSYWVPSSSEAIPPSLHSLSNCMDHVVKSAFYKDYIEHVTAEATLHLLAEIIQQRKKEIGVILIEGKRPRSPIFDNEWDVLEADLEDVGCNIATIVGQTTELKCALLREMAELYPPSGPVKSVFWREPTRWGLKDIMGVILGGASLLER